MDLLSRSTAALSGCLYAAINGLVMSLLIALALANRVRNVIHTQSWSRRGPMLAPVAGGSRTRRSDSPGA
jgi:hypothetical protein